MLKKLVLGSFLLGILLVVLFLGEVAVFSTQNHGGDYSFPQGIVLLFTTFMGLGVLLVFCLSFFAALWRKSKSLAILVVVLLAFIPGIFLAFLLGGIIGKQSLSQVFQSPTPAPSTPTFTGQELWDAVNTYRKENGVVELKLEQPLCNNLAQRYFDIKEGLKEGVAHKGFDEWVEKNKITQTYSINEDFAWGNTPQEVIKAWEGSPGHRLSILNPQNKLGCSYAAEGYGIIILGYKSAVRNVQTNTNQGPSRTGQIINYHEWCEGKDINIYENELITMRSSDGNIYTMTSGDWTCYESFLKSKK